MRHGAVRPTGVQRHFADDEIIVSKTDTRGIITYANDIFLRVSAYTEDEVIGSPHSLIRHPDMPRGVFRLLWDTIAAGDEIFAYVLNLAADGGHYWVLAHVTPTRDRSGSIIGYHSNRRTAAAAALDTVAPLYDAMLAEERLHANARAAADASTALLGRVLAEHDMTYERFVWSLDPDTAVPTTVRGVA